MLRLKAVEDKIFKFLDNSHNVREQYSNFQELLVEFLCLEI